MTKPIRVEDDPRLRISDSDRRANFDLMLRLNALYVSSQDSRKALTKITDEAKAEVAKLDPEMVAAITQRAIDGG